MSDLKIGQLITTERFRDAIHIAVAPVIAGDFLNPGQRIGFREKDNDGDTVIGHALNHIGIVDPFLKEPVRQGERFWMFLLPNSITALRHEWTHPAFGAETGTPETAKKASIAWLEEMASNCGVSYVGMMSAAEDDENIHMGSNERYQEFWDSKEFAKHFEVVMGKAPKSDYIFSCSC